MYLIETLFLLFQHRDLKFYHVLPLLFSISSLRDIRHQILPSQTTLVYFVSLKSLKWTDLDYGWGEDFYFDSFMMWRFRIKEFGVDGFLEGLLPIIILWHANIFGFVSNIFLSFFKLPFLSTNVHRVFVCLFCIFCCCGICFVTRNIKRWISNMLLICRLCLEDCVY